MAGVLLGEAFTFEDVAQMAAAVGADYLRAAPVRVRMSLDTVRIFFIKTRPAAARLEFCLRRVKRVVAAATDKRARRIQRLVLAGERPFRSLVDDDSLFLG